MDPKPICPPCCGQILGWNQKLQRLQKLSHSVKVAYRINEVNSFYGGGKAGVSDTFGSALWCLDYLFNLAAHGCAGVNMETDINQLGFISHYSPIVSRSRRPHLRPAPRILRHARFCPRRPR